MSNLDTQNTVFLLCDIQTKFSKTAALLPAASNANSPSGNAIHGLDQVVDTANKMLKIAKVRVRGRGLPNII